MHPGKPKQPPRSDGSYYQILDRHKQKQEVRNKQVQIDLGLAVASSNGRIVVKKKAKF